MRKLRHTGTLLLALAAVAPAASAQEALQQLFPRPRIAAPAAARQLAPGSPDTLNLPFFDDFSQQPYGAPDRRRWTDNATFINDAYGVNPPTKGVATFDILDAGGHVYQHVGSSSAGADTLTSRPVRLSPAHAGVYLSFAYQPKGMSDDMPEQPDSLTLQLYAPGVGWIAAWHASPDTFRVDSVKVLKEKYFLQTPHDKIAAAADITTQFFKVMIGIGDAQFLQPGFRFRFISYATRSHSDVPGRLGNCDIWNLDLVYLDKDRSASDTMLTDVAIARPPQKLLKEYHAMPWQHLKGSPTAQQEQLVSAAEGRTGVAIAYALGNLGGSTTGLRTDFEVTCAKGAPAAQAKKYSGGAINIQADTARAYEFNLPLNDFLNTPQPNADSVAFDIKTIIFDYTVNPRLLNELRTNDTGMFRQVFYDYYAYDDGTAENGFGVFGANVSSAKVAVKYFSYLRDTLSGVYIHFNSTQDSGNMHQLKLAVWSDMGGLPNDESMLYLEPNLMPRYDSLNAFTYYKLASPVVVEGTFYVGWVQQASAMLNVGFDRNSRPAGKMFVSTNGYTWQHSVYDGQGALMVRPSFARRTDYASAVARTAEAPLSLGAYPNPARNELRLRLPDELRSAPLTIEIFNILGQRVRHEALASETVNVAPLPQGAYIIRLCRGTKNVGYAKFVKN